MRLLLTVALVFAGARADEAVCYTELGCFSNEAPWNTPERPVPPPRSPEDVGTYFTLFTRNTQYTGYNITAVSLNESGYLANRKTVFIVQGLSSLWNVTWLYQLKNNVLQKGDFNVILTRWGLGVPNYNYSYYQAVADTRVVGAELARLGRALIKDCNFSPRNFHVIGHSMGAQIAGYMGQNISGIGRITGLDATHVGFMGYPRVVRLDSRDAEFVEDIHTALQPPIPNLINSQNAPIGHADFYLNGGNVQPGCNKLNKTLESASDYELLSPKDMRNMSGCSHQRAVAIFLEATSGSDCVFWGRKSREIERGAPCRPDTCRPIGLESPHSIALGRFEVTTEAKQPYCIPDSEDSYRRHTSK